MTQHQITVLSGSWDAHRPALERVRKTVFIQEQAVPEAEEWDRWDALSEHFLACTTKRDVVGVGRLQPDGKITRMAVLAAWRGHGIGDRLLVAMMQRAGEKGLRPWLHAQSNARGFYARHGFVVDGDEFEEAGIRHCLMRLTPD